MGNLGRYVLLPALIGGLVGLAIIAWFARSSAMPGYAEAVRQATPSVVNIYTSAVIRPPFCSIPRYRDWCESYLKRNGNRRSSSLGSGVIVGADGYILTNYHVVANADEVLVAFHTGQATAATLVGGDAETDLAVIKVAAKDLPAIALGSAENTRVGDIALAIGNPFGFGQTVSAGIISAKGRAGLTASPYSDFLQTDAAINPGNSGGALVDTKGQLIGINTLIFSRSGGSEGIGFAIPVETAMSVKQQLVTHGKVVRGWLGIDLESVVVNGINADSRPGLRINRLLRDGPAAAAGLRVGDVILSINSEPVSSAVMVSQQIAQTAPGTQLELDLIRGDQQLTLRAQTVVRPDAGP